MQSFPETVKKIWNKWDIRGIVLLSLCLQIVLIIFGNRRKYIARVWVGVIIWITYLSADGVATIALGNISRSQTNSCDNSPEPNNCNAIMAFWAPFLLVHLGGPDTITAYSLEDNELWLRHLLQLLVQVGLVFYIFLRSWSSNPLTFLAIPVFIPGIFKYGERTWVLWSASSRHFRESMIPVPQAGPDYVKFMEEYNRRVTQGLPVSYGGVIEAPYVTRVDNKNPEAKLLQEAYLLFDIFKPLYADLILSFHERDMGMSMLEEKSSDDVFRLIEIELGIMYDLLYSKANIAHSRIGMFLRFVSFLSIVTTLVAFWMVVDKHAFSNIDVTITYLLLVGAIFIEIYAGVLLIFSERTLLYLSKHDNVISNFIYRVVSSIPSASINRKKWSGSMAQYNLIGFCLKDKPTKCEGIQKFFLIYEMLEKFRYKTSEEVTIDLKELIFQQLKQLQQQLTMPPFEDSKKLCNRRGDHVLQRKSCLDKFSWSVVEVEFDHSILLWHIATDLCYYSDLEEYQNATPISKHKISKSLSDYMLYLLVMHPLMLPKGIGEIRYKDTCAEAIRFIQQRINSIAMSRSEVCRLLLEVNTEIEPKIVKGDRSKSVLFDGCRLAKSLQALEREDHWGNGEKWDMITQVWVEMLSYAAIQCQWNQHLQQLSQGGELLSHVCLLMTHLGLSEQFQISSGDARMRVY